VAAQHRESKADLTIAAVSSNKLVSSPHYTLATDDDGWVHELIPPQSGSAGPLCMMGVFLFATDMLGWRLSEDARRADSGHDLIQSVIAQMIRDGDRVMVSHHTGYWDSFPTLYHYWRAHMDLLEDSPALNLQDASWPIRTQYQIRPPTRVARGARVSHSLLSEGCIVDGTVEYSVLSPGVYIGPGAVVRNSVIMHDVTIEERSVVENAIEDMEVIVGPQARVGQAERHAPTLGEAKPPQLTVVPQSTHISAHQVLEPDPATEWYPNAYRDYAPGARVTTT
jgi:glucose-1-phosphate adenylyltransferase